MPKLRRAKLTPAAPALRRRPAPAGQKFLNFSHPESHKSLTNLCLAHMLSRVCKKSLILKLRIQATLEFWTFQTPLGTSEDCEEKCRNLQEMHEERTAQYREVRFR